MACPLAANLLPLLTGFTRTDDHDRYVPDRTPQLLAMTTLAGNSNLPFIAVPGGVLCLDQSGAVLGAVGVSGASADEDEHCAIVGAQSMGCVTQPPKSAL